MNKATHWIIKIILIIAILFVALMWKAATRGATGASSPVPGAIAGVAILALLAMKVKGNRKSPEAPPAPTPLPPADTSPTPLPAQMKRHTVALPIVQNSRITREPQPTPPIMKPDPEPKPSALPFIDDEPFYEEVAKEIESDAMKPGIWARAYLLRDKAKWNGGSRMFHSGRHGEICRHHRARGKAGDAMAQGRSAFR